MKKEYKIFFAIPFDALTKNVYENIRMELQDDFLTKGYNLTTVIGTSQKGHSTDFSEIITFKALNTELHQQFYKQIEDSDIIIADLTNNNPNVHIELGIALSLNKNIFRVIGRDVKELGFDIQSLDVLKYSNKDELLQKIKKYLEVFIKIKNLDFSENYGELYKKITEPFSLPGTDKEIRKDSWFSYTVEDYLFRDGAIRLEVEFLNCLNDRSWAGVYFRKPLNIKWGGYLLHVRKDGSVELALYEYTFIKEIKKINSFAPFEPNKNINFEIEIENDQIKTKINGESFDIPNITQQNHGEIMLATYDCCARFKNIELINRDTIDFSNEK